MASSSTATSGGGVFSRWLSKWSQPTDRTRRVVTSDVVPVANPVHDNQRVERTFTITKSRDANGTDDENDRANLRTLYVSSPGLTVIRVRPELVDEVGPDVLAKVSVSSDERAHIFRCRVDTQPDDDTLSLSYDHRRDTLGHFVAEIDVPTEAQLSAVTACCRGDVVIEYGVLNKTTHEQTEIQDATSTEELPCTSGKPSAVTALSVSRAHLVAPQSDLHFDQLAAFCMGRGSISIAARSLSCHDAFTSMVMGPGQVRVRTNDFSSPALSMPSTGRGSWSFAAAAPFRADDLYIMQAGPGVAQVRAPPGCPAVDSLMLNLGGNGHIDMSSVPSKEATVLYMNTRGGSTRLQSPSSSFFVTGLEGVSNVRGTIKYTGALSPQVDEATRSESLVLKPLSEDASKAVDDHIATPTIREAFEKPVLLENTSEGYFTDMILP